MAYDQQLADRLRRALADPRATEKKMFGGICFMQRDHMLCGTGKAGFLFRVGKEQADEALSRPGASVMEMNGRRMQGFVWVDPARCSDHDLRDWVALAKKFIATLPAKKAK
jgi:TfoX N-terminal domain